MNPQRPPWITPENWATFGPEIRLQLAKIVPIDPKLQGTDRLARSRPPARPHMHDVRADGPNGQPYPTDPDIDDTEDNCDTGSIKYVKLYPYML
jgi:hypothetical protein